MTEPNFDKHLDRLAAEARSETLSPETKQRHLAMLAQLTEGEPEVDHPVRTPHPSGTGLSPRRHPTWRKPTVLVAAVVLLAVGSGLGAAVVASKFKSSPAGPAPAVPIADVESSGRSMPTACARGASTTRTTAASSAGTTVAVEAVLGIAAVSCLRVGDDWYEAQAEPLNLQLSFTAAGPYLWGSVSKTPEQVVVKAGSESIAVGDVAGSLRTGLTNGDTAIIAPLNSALVGPGATLELELITGGTISSVIGSVPS